MELSSRDSFWAVEQCPGRCRTELRAVGGLRRRDTRVAEAFVARSRVGSIFVRRGTRWEGRIAQRRTHVLVLPKTKFAT